MAKTARYLAAAPPSRAAAQARLRSQPALPPSWFLAAGVLLWLVAIPIAYIVVASLRQDEGGVGVGNFVEAFGSWRLLVALGNTLVLGAAVCVGSALLALPLAWAVSRTDIGAKGFIRLSAIIAFICPPYLNAAAWMLLAGPNAGMLNKLWVNMTGAEPVLNIFTFTGIVFVMSTSLFFFVFSFTTAALDVVSSEMEEAATILGARRWRTATLITLPLVAPAILAAMVVVFLQSVALFGVPALLAFPARFPVLVTTLMEFFEVPVRVGAAAAYTLPLLAITAALYWAQGRLTRRRGFVAMTGKGGLRRPIELGRLRVPFTILAIAVCFVVAVLPILALLQAALLQAWGRGLQQDNLTLANFAGLFQEPRLREALINSLLFAAASALLAAVVSIGTAYLVVRRKVPLGSLLGFLAMAPYVIPGMVLSIGFYATFAAPPLSLYGTGLLLILAFSARFLPITYSSSRASLVTMSTEMEEAGRILGASRLTVFLRITLPLVRRSLAASAILIFILASHELSTAVLLVGPSNRVVSTAMLELADNGQMESLAAMGIALLTVTVVLTLLGFRLAGRDFMIGRSG